MNTSYKRIVGLGRFIHYDYMYTFVVNPTNFIKKTESNNNYNDYNAANMTL